MKILAVETSGDSFSAALAEGGRIKAGIFRESGRGRSETLVSDVRSLMKKAGWKPRQLDRIAVSTGPGSFTGIRVGMTFARIAAQDLGIPLVCAGTLDVLAMGLPGEENVMPAIDALRGEVYARKGRGAEILPLEAFLKRLAKTGKKYNIIGSAAVRYGGEIRKALGRKAVLRAGKANYPSASALALAAEMLPGGDYSSAEPMYVRKSWAEEKNK